MNLLTSKIVGKATRPFYPDFGGCGHCGRVWPVCKPHRIRISSIQVQCLALCTDCNADLTPEQKLPHYQRLMTRWANEDTAMGEFERAADVFEHTWPAVKAAVMEGN